MRGGVLAARWAPALAWMAAIFYFSSRPDPLGFLGRFGEHGLVGVVLHVLEYLGLVLLLQHALSQNPRPSSTIPPLRVGGRTPWLAGFLALGYAVLDELHQRTVRGRSFEVADLGYDLVGIAVALLLMHARGRARAGRPIR